LYRLAGGFRTIFIACLLEVITQDPLWLSAQVPFVELSDHFGDDPVAV
jgi:hypothetical protein